MESSGRCLTGPVGESTATSAGPGRDQWGAFWAEETASTEPLGWRKAWHGQRGKGGWGGGRCPAGSGPAPQRLVAGVRVKP